MEFPEFHSWMSRAIETRDDSYPSGGRMAESVVEWPDHAKRALERISEYEDGERPMTAWIDEMVSVMREDGARL